MDDRRAGARGTLISASPGEEPGLTEFQGVANLVGGEVGNVFMLGALGSLTGSITGQGLPLTNFLASETGIHWSITGADSGNLDRIGEGLAPGTPGFSDIATLVGLTGDNQFVLEPGGSLTGSIIGGLGDNRADLKSTIFKVHRYRWLWEAYEKIRAADYHIDFHTLRDELVKAGHYEELTAQHPLDYYLDTTLLHVEANARQVREMAERRRIDRQRHRAGQRRRWT